MTRFSSKILHSHDTLYDVIHPVTGPLAPWKYFQILNWRTLIWSLIRGCDWYIFSTLNRTSQKVRLSFRFEIATYLYEHLSVRAFIVHTVWIIPPYCSALESMENFTSEPIDDILFRTLFTDIYRIYPMIYGIYWLSFIWTLQKLKDKILWNIERWSILLGKTYNMSRIFPTNRYVECLIIGKLNNNWRIFWGRSLEADVSLPEFMFWKLGSIFYDSLWWLTP